MQKDLKIPHSLGSDCNQTKKSCNHMQSFVITFLSKSCLFGVKTHLPAIQEKLLRPIKIKKTEYRIHKLSSYGIYRLSNIEKP